MLMIHQMAVVPARRRQGLGGSLVRASVDDAIGSGASIVALTFDDTERGLSRFYERLGFTCLAGAEISR
jgi:predicted N-acetyltransferase YhbS